MGRGEGPGPPLVVKGAPEPALVMTLQSSAMINLVSGLLTWKLMDVYKVRDGQRRVWMAGSMDVADVVRFWVGLCGDWSRFEYGTLLTDKSAVPWLFYSGVPPFPYSTAEAHKMMRGCGLVLVVLVAVCPVVEAQVVCSGPDPFVGRDENGLLVMCPGQNGTVRIEGQVLSTVPSDREVALERGLAAAILMLTKNNKELAAA